jgi:hypothetical protein
MKINWIRMIGGVGALAAYWLALPNSIYGMSVSGLITASSVTVSGDVSMSSVTVSTLSLTGSFNYVGGASLYLPGRVLQIHYSSNTTTGTDVDTTTWTAVSGSSVAITLINANDSVRISLSGSLRANWDGYPVYLTIYRGSTNLGDATSGVTGSYANNVVNGSSSSYIGLSMLDSPGDTVSHTYQVYIRATNVESGYATFPWSGAGFLILEEIAH